MVNQLNLNIEESRIIQGLTKQRMEELSHILVHQMETENYRMGAQKELHQLIHLQHKLNVFIQDVDNLRRDDCE